MDKTTRITVFLLPQNEPFTSIEQVLFHNLYLISQFQPTNLKQTKELKVITSQNLTVGPDFDDSCFNVNGRWRKPGISMSCDFLLKEWLTGQIMLWSNSDWIALAILHTSHVFFIRSRMTQIRWVSVWFAVHLPFTSTQLEPQSGPRRQIQWRNDSSLFLRFLGFDFFACNLSSGQEVRTPGSKYLTKRDVPNLKMYVKENINYIWHVARLHHLYESLFCCSLLLVFIVSVRWAEPLTTA